MTSKDTIVQIRWADVVMRELGVLRVDLLKIDFEGYEKNVLVGLAETLKRDRPAIVFELVGREVKGGLSV